VIDFLLHFFEPPFPLRATGITDELGLYYQFSFRATVLFWLAVFRDLGSLLQWPVLILGGVVGLMATAFKFRLY
jgi:hypothetical protein